METLEALLEKKKDLMEKIVKLKDMRRGSVVEQFFEVKRKDGTVVRQGPYVLYSYKEKGKTISRRLPTAARAERYQAEINEYRRFEKLCSELVETSQQICDLKHQAEESPEHETQKKNARAHHPGNPPRNKAVY